jgi:hypothetical protein
MDRAGDLLKSVFSFPDAAAGEKYLPLFKNWKSIVGNDLAKRVTLKDIRKDCLVAEVAHPGWLQAVLLRKKTIIKRVNTLYQGIGIKDIKVNIVKKLAPRVVIPGSQGKKSPLETEPEYSAGQIDDLLSGLNENELKKALKKLFSAHGKRKRD